MNKKFIIYGFGRMGLTHYAILNQLIENTEFVFVDPNKKVNFFAKRNLSAKIVSSDQNLNQTFDFALICTPPMFHVPILEKCIKQKIPNIFVEKPFGGVSDDFSSLVNSDKSISIGYVLRFNPIIQWVKGFIDIEKVEKVEGLYFSNTIEQKPKGWRNGSYSGVTNEVGAHIIDLCVYVFGLSNPLIINKQTESIISDVEDILIADLEDKSIKYHFHFDWVNKNYRKPVFKFTVTFKDDTFIKFDQQKAEYFDNCNNLISSISVADLAQKVPFYLRGVEFTSQMQDFVGLKKTISNLSDALITRNVIKNLLLNETNFRR
jgi:predicted dehydrogenase